MTVDEWLDYQQEKRLRRRAFADNYGQRFNANECLEDDEADQENEKYR